jgi:hypothetical protein
MSKISLSGPATGTATFTITTPAGTSTDRTLSLPDSTGTIATAESTLAQFNASGSAPVYACRAWVNFDGTGTPAIRASGNVSSITDNGTGDYTVNFTTAMPDANFVVNVAAAINSGEADLRLATVNQNTAQSTTQIRVTTFESFSNRVDRSFVYVAIFR